MTSRFFGLGCLWLLTVGSAALADGSGKSAVVRGPDSKTPHGLSRTWRAVLKGDRAFASRDFATALASYKEAIAIEPQNALGYYRAGETEVESGNLPEADAEFELGLRFVGADALLRAKLEFSMADLRERQRALDDASAKWTEYEAFTLAAPSASGSPASAGERRRAIAAFKKASAEAAQVKSRIEKRVSETNATMRRSSP